MLSHVIFNDQTARESVTPVKLSRRRRIRAKTGYCDGQKYPDKIRIATAIEPGGDHNFYCGFEEEGVFIATWDICPAGTEVALTIAIEGSEVLFSVSGHVRWLRETDGLDPDILPGIGIEFDAETLTDEMRSIIDDYHQICPPIFY